jgi:tubulin--tyrosine ligase
LDALSTEGEGYESRGKIDRKWLDETFIKVGEVVAESVKAGAECGSFGLQLVPNAFEVCPRIKKKLISGIRCGSTVEFP